MPSVILSHTSGNANTRGAVVGLCKRGLLHSFHVSVAAFERSWYWRLLSLPLLREFRKRQFDGCLRPFTRTYPLKDVGRLLAGKLHWSMLTRHEAGVFSTWQVCKRIDGHVARYLRRHEKEDVQAVYCYEDIALATFREAKRQGKLCLYDLPIGYWRSMHKLLDEERVKHPDWAVTLGGFNDSEAKLQQKDEELRLADIIYVASTFTKESLSRYPGTLASIEVIPYGFPEANIQRRFEPIIGRKIRLLYVGGLSQRKGIAYLFEALQGLEERFELTVVGGGDIEGCPAMKAALRTCRYLPPQPHERVLEIMAEHDVFVFPSLFEGFGLVITEAMSQGTPAITTDRTCGPDIITHGHDGWLVEAGSAEALRNQLLHLADHPEEIPQAGKQAILTAQARPWTKYETEVADSVERFLKSRQ